MSQKVGRHTVFLVAEKRLESSCPLNQQVEKAQVLPCCPYCTLVSMCFWPINHDLELSMVQSVHSVQKIDQKATCCHLQPFSTNSATPGPFSPCIFLSTSAAFRVSSSYVAWRDKNRSRASCKYRLKKKKSFAICSFQIAALLVDVRTPAPRLNSDHSWCFLGPPAPPQDVTVRAGSTPATVQVSWKPPTLTATGTSHGATVTGYGVYARGQRVSSPSSLTVTSR